MEAARWSLPIIMVLYATTPFVIAVLLWLKLPCAIKPLPKIVRQIIKRISDNNRDNHLHSHPVKAQKYDQYTDK